MKKIKIDKIYRNDTKQDGSKYMSKTGKPFKYVTIYTTGKDGKQHKLSNCDYDEWTVDFHEGQVIMVTVEKSGNFINFSKPTKTDELEVKVEDLQKRIEALERGQGVMNPASPPASGYTTQAKAEIDKGVATVTDDPPPEAYADGPEPPMEEPGEELPF